MTVPSLLPRLIKNELQAIAWGVTGEAGFRLAQSPFPIAGFIDSNPRLFGQKAFGLPVANSKDLARFDPARTVLVPFTDVPASLAAMARDGGEAGFRVLTPWAPPWPRNDSLDDGPWKDFVHNLRLERDDWLREFGKAPADTGARRAMLFCQADDGLYPPRHLAQLAVRLRREGWSVILVRAGHGIWRVDLRHILTSIGHAGAENAYLPSERQFWEFGDGVAWHDEALRDAISRVRSLPHRLGHQSVALFELMRRWRPSRLIAFGVKECQAAAFAGVLGNVARLDLILDNTEEFAADPDCQAALKILAPSSRVHISGLTQAVTQNVAQLLDPPADRLHTAGYVTTSFDGDVMAVRREIGIAQDAPLLIGCLDLRPACKPLLFLDIAKRLLSTVADLHVVLVGDGPMAGDVLDAVQAIPDNARLSLLGARREPERYLAASDVLLHVAEAHIVPDAILTSQRIGRPCVTVSDTLLPDALAPALHPFLHRMDDVEAIARSCTYLLQDRSASRSLGMQAQQWLASIEPDTPPA